MNVDREEKVVCLVGANGTGKSQLLELIAVCANHIGISPGHQAPRGNPLVGDHELTITFQIPEGFDQPTEENLKTYECYALWDRSFSVTTKRIEGQHSLEILAGGINDPIQLREFTSNLKTKLSEIKDVNFLSLDADRAYPHKAVRSNELAEAYSQNWEEAGLSRGRAYQSTMTLYDEWTRYFLARENQAATKHVAEIREARQTGAEEPEFVDAFDDYRKALTSVLPHMRFLRADSQQKSIIYDTSGVELPFHHLSGGEREIAFLIGQIDRFGLKNGLFLLDEPELHLNAELIRDWVAYLEGTIQTGQVWLATHSLEATEAAGEAATIVLERDPVTRKVRGASRLDDRPALSVLARAIGTPAFSIANTAFVYVEGIASLGERERFRELAGNPSALRFIEGGGCSEVRRRVATISELSSQTETGIRVAGIVDGDFMSVQERQSIASCGNFHVLDVHEVENFFLHPPTLDQVLNQMGVSRSASDLILEAADERAGSWIFQYAFANGRAHGLPAISASAKSKAKGASWSDFQPEQNLIDELAASSGFGTSDQDKFKKLLEVAARSYERKRSEPGLWKQCEGKQVSVAVASKIGFSNLGLLSGSINATWSKGAHIPKELSKLRTFLSTV